MIHAETNSDAFVENSREILKTLYALNATMSTVDKNTTIIKDSVENGAHEVSRQVQITYSFIFLS